MSVLAPSFSNKSTNYDFTPDMLVYVPVLHSDDEVIDGLTAREAYLTESGARKHFWFKNSGKFDNESASVLKMTVKEYLQQYDKQGMNPFETLAIREFLKLYQQIHGSLNL